MANTKPLTPNAKARIEMFRRVWTTLDVARRAGLDRHTVTNVLSGNKRSEITRRKIEAAMELAIWTPENVFAERLPMIRFYGADIETLTIAELRTKVTKVTGKHRLPHTPEPLRAILEDHFTARAASAAHQTTAETTTV